MALGSIVPQFERRLALALAGAAFLAAGLAWAEPPAPPSAPARGFGAPPGERVAVESGSFPNPIARDFDVHWFRPAGRTAGERLPVVVFLHGFGSPNERPYREWLEHLAARGQFVLFPVYPALESNQAPTRYDTMWAGVEAAVRRGAPAPGAQPDATRLGVMGHSFGGGAAPSIAARAAARGWGSTSLWILSFAPWYDLDRPAWASLPAHTHLVAVAFEDDRVCDPGIAGTFPDLATTIPAERKAFRCLRSDPHGSPALRADHLTPLTFLGVDAYDTRGTWALADALAAAAAGDAAARRVALGADMDALDLGRWSDGVPVRPPLAAWPPSPGATDAARRQWRPGGIQEEAMRRLLGPEAYSSLPLPPPTVVRASRLPASERFLAAPPTAPWPAPVARALEKGPVLVRSVGAPPLDPSVTALLGVTVVDGAAIEGTPLAEAFAKRRGPTALLLSRTGLPLLWRSANDPYLPAAVADLLR